jgi:glycosyltransferase involved in cell wall biosynthesis
LKVVLLMKKKILITGPYLPGKSFGGPVKSLYNMVESLGDYYDFMIITNDRDLKSDVQYKNIVIGGWNQVGKAKVLYSPNKDYYRNLKNTVAEINFDLVYCSSFFANSSLKVQFLKLIKKIRVPIIIAPRGEFSSGALKIKSFKKHLYLKVYKIFKMHKKITFTCSSPDDKRDIERVFGRDIVTLKAGNIVNAITDGVNNFRAKSSGEIRIATVSRISSIKNIDYSLNILRKMHIPNNRVIFDIYGPIEDKEYFKHCLDIISKIEENIQICFKGAIDYEEVVNTLKDYHIFLFPTKGENFGHVIQEALLSGCPVIISDQTPWKGLQNKGAGFEFPLNNINNFIEAISYYINMDNDEYKLHSDKAYKYGIYKVENQIAIKEHIDLFNSKFDLKRSIGR